MFLADTFTMRQTQAAGLKVKIDRADRLDDSQLADLRAEIKVGLIINTDGYFNLLFWKNY